MKPTADELLERYADAVAQDTSRPSAPVREAIRAHANMLAQARAATPTEPPVASNSHAANQSRWAFSLLASLAVVGLSTLLMLQMDRGSPQDREVAMGAPKPAHTAPEPAPARARESVAAPPAQEARTKAQALGSAQGVLADSGPAPAKPAAPPAPSPRADSVANMAMHKAAAPTVQFLDAVRGGQIAIAEALVQQGQSVNSRDDKGDTALIVAVRLQQTGMVAKLLALGADRQLINRDGFTAQDIARQLDLSNMVELLQAPQ